MSFNPDPDWTEDIVYPGIGLMRCPSCGTIAFNAEEIVQDLQSVNRHIPPFLLLTCGNPACELCDEDFRVYLGAVVFITKIETDTERKGRP